MLLRSLFLLVLATTCAGTLSACNTVQGVGKDLESAGRGIQDTF